jgi:GLPGLI family protein
MTKLFLTLLIIVTISSNAQQFQGKAEYFSKYIFKKDIASDEKISENQELEEALKAALKSSSEKSFSLTFSKFEALYEENEVLDKPKAASGGISISVSFSGAGKKYINTKDKITLEEDEIFGKEFLIEEKLVQPAWSLREDSKKIGDYNCFKAELIIPVTEQDKKAYQEFLKKEETKPALFKMDEPKDKVITAWYTPEIPVSFGPNNYWGLPGLILEINEENTVILCSKVLLNSKDKTEIKKPKNGDKVSKEKFDEIQRKKMDSMKDEDGNVIFQTIEH